MDRPFYTAPNERRLLPDACCGDKAAAPASGARRRLRLSDLDVHMLCSILGTCLPLSDLRRLVPRFADLDRARATDLELHHAAVQLAGEGGAAAKALHKALDDRHEAALKRALKSRDAEAVRAQWAAALKDGDIPGAYWAVMTHPDAGEDVRKAAFGDVHMLSHLMGAANRADIRRLVEMEREIESLKEQAGRQQQRLQAMSAEHQSALGDLARRLAEAPSAAARPAIVADDSLRAALAAKEQMLAHQTARREHAEEQARQAQEALAGARLLLDAAQAESDALRAELAAVEGLLAQRADLSAHHGVPDESHEGAGPRAAGVPVAVLQGRRIVYVGGRPGSNRTIRSLVEAAGGEIVQHDGGIEDRKGLLAATLPGADAVLFPVDCVDHDSMNQLKRVCERHGVPWRALRTSSAATFAAWLAQEAVPPSSGAPSPGSPSPGSPSRFCLRHG